MKKFAIEEMHIRNQRGAYTHTFNRLDLLAEMKLLFQTQRSFGNPYASGELEKEEHSAHSTPKRTTVL